VILTIGYPVVRWTLPDAAKWAVIALGSLVATIGLCVLVRGSALLRALFGMKPAFR
jgi:hypothetical protein